MVELQTREYDLSPELASLKEGCRRGKLRLAVKVRGGEGRGDAALTYGRAMAAQREWGGL